MSGSRVKRGTRESDDTIWTTWPGYAWSWIHPLLNLEMCLLLLHINPIHQPQNVSSLSLKCLNFIFLLALSSHFHILIQTPLISPLVISIVTNLSFFPSSKPIHIIISHLSKSRNLIKLLIHLKEKQVLHCALQEFIKVGTLTWAVEGADSRFLMYVNPKEYSLKPAWQPICDKRESIPHRRC